MGIKVEPEAFKKCHGFATRDELLLFSPGVVGALSDVQEPLCDKIKIEGKVYDSYADVIENTKYEPDEPVERETAKDILKKEARKIAKYCGEKKEPEKCAKEVMPTSEVKQRKEIEELKKG